MLLRGLETVVVFVNSATPLNPKYDPARPPGDDDIDFNLPPLFGVPHASTGSATQNNQVFATAEYARVVRALQDAKADKNGAIAITELTTVDNLWWGVAAGQAVRICWVYLDRVPNWEAKLPGRVRRAVKRGNRGWWCCRGPFAHFPNYKTVGENTLEMVELTDAQVRLLADLACWTVTENRELFEGLLGAPAVT